MKSSKRRPDAAVVLAGAIALALGGLSALGYAFRVTALVQPLQSFPPMAFSVALCMIAIGIALVVEGGGAVARKSLAAVGALIAANGVAVCIESWSGAALGIDVASLHRSAGVGGATPGRPTLSCGICLVLLGSAAAGLPFAASRRTTLPLATVAAAAGALAGTSLAGYLLGVEFMISWPSRTPLPPQAAFGFTVTGFSLCRAFLHRAREQASPGDVDDGRRIHVTAVWVLSLVAVTAGIATFALAQYEYQNIAHGNLERTLRERRAFLEYSIREHVDQVSLAANHPMLFDAVEAMRQGHEVDATREALRASANGLVERGFSGWRYEIGDDPVVAGTFIRDAALTVALVGRYQTDLIFSGGYFLRTRIPIRSQGRVIGFAVAEEPFPELARMQLQADSWGDSGTMALCAGEGEGLQCFPLRSNPNPSHIPRHANGQPLPMSHALDFETGVVETLDYLNHRVMAAYGPVGFTGLGMVIKIDAAELNRPLGDRFGYAILVLIALVAGGVYLMRRQLAPLIDALKHSRAEAARVSQQFKAAAESSLDACFIMSAIRDTKNEIVDFRIEYKNASGEVLTGRASEDVVGKTLKEVLPPQHAAFLIERYRQIVSTGQSMSEEFRTAGVAAAWVAHQAVKLGDGVSVTARDITQRKAVEAQLRSRAENDILTGLPNRTLFFERLELALSKARAHRVGIAVLFLDVDHFKKVNDTHGHPTGDAVLVEFAQRLRRSVRAQDIVARLSGDEFAVLVELTDIAQVEHIATHIVEALAPPFEFEDKRLSISASIGIGFTADGMDSAQSLVARADRKLYQAKAAGRGRFSSVQEANAA